MTAGPVWPAEADSLLYGDEATIWSRVRDSGRVLLRENDCRVFTASADVSDALHNPALRRMVPAGSISDSELTDWGRDLLGAAMTPRVAEAWAAQFRRPMAYIVDVAAARGGCEAMAEVCLPAATVMNWLLFGAEQIGPAGQMNLWDAIRARRRSPGGDLTSRLMALAPQLTDEEIFRLVAPCATPLISTAQLLAVALYELGRSPPLARRLRDEPAGVPVFVEELIRLAPKCPSRVAATDTTVGGVDVLAGERIMLAVSCANREADGGDEINSRVRRHWGFGAGRYRCRANHVARRLLIAAVETWLARIPDFSVPPGFVPTYRAPDEGVISVTPVSVWKDLPLTWDG